MLKYIAIISVLSSCFIIGCSANQTAKSQPKSNQSQESRKEKEELSQLKDLYSKKLYLPMVRTFNEGGITDSKALNKIYAQAFDALYQQKQFEVLEGLIDSSNTGPIPEETLKKYKKACEEYQQNQSAQKLKDTIDKMVQDIDSQYYDSAVLVAPQQTDNREILTLKHYAQALADYQKYNDPTAPNFLNPLVWIDPDYNGVKSNEIKQFAHRFLTDQEWWSQHDQEVTDEQKLEAAKNAVAEQANKPEPKIGMTADEVLASRWGKPTEIHKTTTQNDVSEQWVYFGNSKYIYLDNGVVTAIQE